MHKTIGHRYKMRRLAEGGLHVLRGRLPLLACTLTLLTACSQENQFVAPPPPKVIVQLPVQQTVTPYLEATGNAASVNTVKLLARVQGYVQETQIGLVLLIALSAKNAILIVEVARERRIFDGKPVIEAALEAARARFRPILMTSFAFILGVMPLVLATGAGASSRKSIGIAVSSGMVASTCLAVLFVPSFFVVVRRFEEWRAAHKGKGAAKTAPAE